MRYFLHLRNSAGFLPDAEGMPATSAEEARGLAIESIRSLLSEEVKAGRIDLRGRIEVANATGTLALVVPFADAVVLITAEATT